jgi:hypothetical protein
MSIPFIFLIFFSIHMSRTDVVSSHSLADDFFPSPLFVIVALLPQPTGGIVAGAQEDRPKGGER